MKNDIDPGQIILIVIVGVIVMFFVKHYKKIVPFFIKAYIVLVVLYILCTVNVI